MLRFSIDLAFTRQNSYTLGKSYMPLKHAYSLGYLCRHNSEDTQILQLNHSGLLYKWFNGSSMDS